MRVSLSWINRLLAVERLPVPVAELQRLLTLRLAEIEPDPIRTGPPLDGVVVGKVLTCAQHPNAERLRVTTVDAGGGRVVPVVCGAPNVAAGQTVALATVGTKLSMPGKDGQPTSIVIKEAKLRGEPSQGMICAEDELGLGVSHDGIMVLDARLAAGTPLVEALGLGSTALGVENIAITHRPDLWGQWGWAREVAAILGLPAPAEPDLAWQDLDGGYGVDIRDEGCLVYAGAVVEGVDNRESPAWLRQLLESMGIRPLGLLVDVTNFVMCELGEPMHAFDLRDLDGRRVCVRPAAAGERLSTLDGREHQLRPEDMVIADGRRALALAGIMGGEAGMVRADTSAILLEAAVFNGTRIRRSRQRLGCATDSSARFEKGLYPEGAAAAINRACALLREIIPGCRVTARFRAGRTAGEARPIALDAGLLRRMSGIDLDAGAQQALLASLGIQGSHAQGFSVPWWRRKDLRLDADLVEELARLHGFERIAPEAPRLRAEAPAPNRERETEHQARRLLAGQGWDEVQTYAFTARAWAEALGEDAGSLIVLPHPLSQEHALMRPSLLPNLLEALSRNRKHLAAVAIYELGRRYRAGCGRGIRLDEAGACAGVCASAGDEAPFYAARDAAAALLDGLGWAGAWTQTPEDAPGWTPGRRVCLRIGKTLIGEVGEVDAARRRLAACPERVGAFILDLDAMLLDVPAPGPVAHRPPSRFPAVERDFTWVCPEATPFAGLAEASRSAAGRLCRGVELVGIWRGEGLDAGHKAVSLRLVLQSDDGTLEEAEIQKLQERIVRGVSARCGARLRA